MIMKNKITILLGKSVLLLGLSFIVSSCDEAFLDEVPKDFLSPENAYTDLAGFETAITTLHSNARDFWMEGDGPNYFVLPGLGTDFANYGENFTSGARMDYSALSPTDVYANEQWNRAYKLIKNANTIISRAESDKAKWKTETEKAQIVAEARFFRAWAYRLLGNLFGGVPIIEEEITSPKIDFVSSTRDEVYHFAKEDLEFAATNLPETEKASGRISKAAANHLLSEINICLKDWQGAIDAASLVINNPNFKLMTQRFGRRTSVNGDVFWDLFQRGNQNRTSGNKEAIWVIQVEYKTPGGGDKDNNGYHSERAWGARYHSIKDPDGKNGFVLSDEMGRPVGWCLLTNYLQQTIWQSDWNDMRNSTYNIKREYYYNDPTSAYFGKLATKEVLASQELRYYQPFLMKVTTPFDHPDGILNTGRIYRDIYAMRLAETYLLRAEAYLGKNDKANAAADINVVRARANAIPVNSADVTIDYILDERARELVTEEFRTCTLMRLGLLYDRVKNYSMILKGDGSVVPSTPSTTIQPKNNLWPIPQAAIDLNGGAKLEQNPGY